MSFEFADSWSVESKTAGGCFNTSKWSRNPQYFVTVRQPDTQVDITLTQRPSASQTVKPAIGFYILKTDGTGRKILDQPQELVVGKAAFIGKDTNSLSVKLSPQDKDLPYVILPCTFQCDEDAEFTLKIEGNDILVEDMQSENRKWTSKIEISSEWTKDTAGGCRNYDTHEDNPQIVFQLPSMDTQNLKILLTRTQEEEKSDVDFDVLGIYLMKIPKSKLPPKNKKFIEMLSEWVLVKAKFQSSEESSLYLPNVKQVALEFGDKSEDDLFCIIPSTFDPKFFSKFDIQIYSDGPILNASLLGENRGIEINGKWGGTKSVSFEEEGEGWGGCMNYSSWRDNTQYFIYVKKDVRLNIKLTQIPNFETNIPSIGFYVLNGNEGGKRQIKIKPADDVVTKSGFYEGRSVSHEVELKKNFNESEGDLKPYIFLPCTFDPISTKNEIPFLIELFCMTEKGIEEGDIKIIPADDLVTVKSSDENVSDGKGEWKDYTAGGCMNYSTWPNNPQYYFRLKNNENENQNNISEQITILLTQPKKSSGEKSIGSYVFVGKGNDHGGKRWKWAGGEIQSKISEEHANLSNEKDIYVKRAKFRKQKEVSMELNVNLNQWYTIIPALFHAGMESTFKILIYYLSGKTNNFTLDFERAVDIPVPDYENNNVSGPLTISGEWNEWNSGGCINSELWMNNPHFLLEFDINKKLDGKINLNLTQNDESRSGSVAGKEWPAIGFYLNKAMKVENEGKEYLFPKIAEKEDFIKKTEFEHYFDISMDLTWDLIRDVAKQDNVEDGKVNIVLTPCTFEPGVTSKFRLWLYAEVEALPNIKISEIMYAEEEEEEEEENQVIEEEGTPGEQIEQVGEQVKPEEPTEVSTPVSEIKEEDKDEQQVASISPVDTDKPVEESPVKDTPEPVQESPAPEKPAVVIPENSVQAKPAAAIPAAQIVATCPCCRTKFNVDSGEILEKGQSSPSVVDTAPPSVPASSSGPPPAPSSGPPPAPSAGPPPTPSAGPPPAPSAGPPPAAAGNKFSGGISFSNVKLRPTQPRSSAPSARSLLLQQVNKGVQLKSAANRVLGPKQEETSWSVPFNFEKIVSARRAAMADSDEEDEESNWDDEW